MKRNDLPCAIEELQKAVSSINEVADWLSASFHGEVEQPKVAPVKEPEITLEDVRSVLADLSRQGHTAEILSILQQYGAQKLSEVNPAEYIRLLKDVEAMLHAD